MKQVQYFITTVNPRSADDVIAVHVDFRPGDEPMQFGAFFSIAQARELSLALARAADEAELKLPK